MQPNSAFGHKPGMASTRARPPLRAASTGADRLRWRWCAPGRTGAGALLLAAALLTGCQSVTHEPLATVGYVDLERFMGDWYVLAAIPTPLEENAFNALESYRLAHDGSIETTFTYREGGFEGPRREFQPRGFVEDRDSNAVWGMQFVWPIRADYRVIHLDEDYSHTVIGRNRRDYVWVMSRHPRISPTDYQRLLAVVAEAGYDLTRVRRVPQRWEDAGNRR